MSRQKNTLLVAVGKRIRALRKAKKWTQTDLAVELGLDRGHLSEIECGKRAVNLLTLQTIARGLGTTMSRLLKDL